MPVRVNLCNIRYSMKLQNIYVPDVADVHAVDTGDRYLLFHLLLPFQIRIDSSCQFVQSWEPGQPFF